MLAVGFLGETWVVGFIRRFLRDMLRSLTACGSMPEPFSHSLSGGLLIDEAPARVYSARRDMALAAMMPGAGLSIIILQVFFLILA